MTTRAKAAKIDAPEGGTADATATQASFEATLERLHHLVVRLESGELSLEESLVLFEEGVRLSRTSQARLNSAEKRIEELLAIGEDGEPIVRALDIPPS